MIIEKKCWPKQFQAILDGKKNFDIRLDDLDVKENDFLILREFNPETKQYTGRQIQKQIKYIMKTSNVTFWSEDDKKKGFIVLGF